MPSVRPVLSRIGSAVRTPISILLADDHMMFRSTLRAWLDKVPDFKVVADVNDAHEAVEHASSLQPDIVLWDVSMPGQCPFEAARQIKGCSPDTHNIFLSGLPNDQSIHQAIGVNASGYLLKTDAPEKLVDAIHSVMTGSKYYTNPVRSRMRSKQKRFRSKSLQTRYSTLTRREREVLCYIAQGLSKKQIALLIHVSHRTVEAHCRRLMDKLDIHDRVELARYAIREGLIEA